MRWYSKALSSHVYKNVSSITTTTTADTAVKIGHHNGETIDVDTDHLMAEADIGAGAATLISAKVNADLGGVLII